MKLLLDMYRSAPKEQRDKVQLMAAEKKAKAEVFLISLHFFFLMCYFFSDTLQQNCVVSLFKTEFIFSALSLGNWKGLEINSDQLLVQARAHNHLQVHKHRHICRSLKYQHVPLFGTPAVPSPPSSQAGLTCRQHLLCAAHIHGVKSLITQRYLRKRVIKRYKKIGQAVMIMCKAEPDKCVLTAHILHVTGSFYTLLCLTPICSSLISISLHIASGFEQLLIPTVLPFQELFLVYSVISYKVQVALPGSGPCSFLESYQLL